jgi:hypothetical protein
MSESSETGRTALVKCKCISARYNVVRTRNNAGYEGSEGSAEGAGARQTLFIHSMHSDTKDGRRLVSQRLVRMYKTLRRQA